MPSSPQPGATATRMPTLLHEPEAIAVRGPVDPAVAATCVAASVPILYVPLDAASQRSLIPDGGVKLAALAHEAPKTRSVSGSVVVIDGAATVVDAVAPLL